MIAMSEEPFAAFSGLPELGAETAERLSTSVLPLLRGLPRPLRARVLELLTRLLEDEAGSGNGRDTAVFDPSATPPTILATRARDAAGPEVGGGDEAGREARFEDLGLLGQGGMGEVRRMRDRDLGRTLAMKLIDPSFMASPGLQARFVEEAQICARLQHPGIVPIYEFGRLASGRLYFTMQEIRGHSFGVQIRQFHAQAGAARDSPGLRRLIDTFHRVCEAVAYAHVRGVVHRDLKPDNIMLGREGQVLVVDWGIASMFGASEAAEDGRGAARGEGTRSGSVTGTPAYMAPEQLLGQSQRIDARSDVYGLGLILYEILAGRLPAADGPLARALNEVPALEEVVTEHALPAALVEICQRAVRLDPAQRFQDAGELGLAVAEWMEGLRQREHALLLVSEASELATFAAGQRREAAQLRQQATARLKELPSWTSEEIKHPLWQQLQAADRLDQQATQRRLESEQRLHAALTFAPGLIEAHEALALRHWEEHVDAEANRREDDAARAEFYLRTHAAVLPGDSPVRARLITYLRAEGELCLQTEPANASIEIHPYVLRDRRLHEAPALGPPLAAPLVGHALAMGSYVLRIAAPGRASVWYPLEIGRGQSWDATPPRASAPAPVWLPPSAGVGAEEAYVPAGWFRAGGDPAALNALPGCRLWLDGFVIRREPVSNREYLEFINDLIARGAVAEAQRFVPIDMKVLPPAPIYRRTADGRFVCGDSIAPEWPVVHIDWASARGFCRWLGARDGLPWRLPDELEWEKAARGVDGRLYPWGDWLDPSWCWIRDSHPNTPSLAVSAAHPVDRSPYGVLGMVGNSMDWCANAFVAPEQFDARPRRVRPHIVGEDEHEGATMRIYRGGSWCYHAQLCRPARRFRHAPDTRVNDLGVRPVRSLGPTTG